MKKELLKGLTVLIFITMAGCTQKKAPELQEDAHGCLMHIGLVTDRSGVDDNAFNQSVWNGITRFAEEQGIPSQCYGYLQAISEEEYIPYLCQLAEEDYDLIIAADYQFVDAVNTVAKTYPNHHFLLIDNESELPNVSSALFSAHEGSFLAGVAAALKAQELESHTVGFIGAKSSDLIGAFQAGFEQGVAAIDSEMSILISYTEDFYDEVIAQDMAFLQFEAGASVIYHAAGNAGIGVINEAKEWSDVWVIGVDYDQYEEGMKEEGTSVILTSMLKRVDQASYLSAMAVLEGQFTGGVRQFTLAEEGVSLELSEDRNLSEEQIKIIEDYAAKIKNNEISVSQHPQLSISEFNEEE